MSITDSDGLTDLINDTQRSLKISSKSSKRAQKSTQKKLSPPVLYRDSEKFRQEFGRYKKTIGHGTFGTVYQTDKNFAIKKIVLYKDHDLGIDHDTCKEIAILKYLHHPGVLPICGVTFDVDKHTVKMALPLGQRTLDTIIYNGITLQERKKILYQLLQAVAYCHAHSIWHLDIKPQNIIEFSGGRYKLADFGLAKFYAHAGIEYSPYVVTLWWRPPEILLGDSHYTEKADLWSLGVILLEMILGKQILGGASKMDQLSTIFKWLGSPTEKDWPGVTKLPQYISKYSGMSNLLDRYTKQKTTANESSLLKKLLAWPNTRISALEALTSPYFDEIRAPRRIPEINYCQNELYRQIQLTAPLVSWKQDQKMAIYKLLWNVKKHFKLEFRTLLYAYYLFEYYMARRPVNKLRLRLLGITTIMMAANIHDVYPLDLFDLLYYTNDQESLFVISHTIKEVKQLHADILATIDFNLVLPTCATFADYLLSRTCRPTVRNLIEATMCLMMTHINWSLKYSQYEIALSAINIVSKKLNLSVKFGGTTRLISAADYDTFSKKWGRLRQHITEH